MSEEFETLDKEWIAKKSTDDLGIMLIKSQNYFQQSMILQNHQPLLTVITTTITQTLPELKELLIKHAKLEVELEFYPLTIEAIEDKTLRDPERIGIEKKLKGLEPRITELIHNMLGGFSEFNDITKKTEIWEFRNFKELIELIDENKIDHFKYYQINESLAKIKSFAQKEGILNAIKSLPLYSKVDYQWIEDLHSKKLRGELDAWKQEKEENEALKRKGIDKYYKCPKCGMNIPESLVEKGFECRGHGKDEHEKLPITLENGILTFMRKKGKDSLGLWNHEEVQLVNGRWIKV